MGWVYQLIDLDLTAGRILGFCSLYACPALTVTHAARVKYPPPPPSPQQIGDRMLQYWSNNTTTLCQCVVFDGLAMFVGPILNLCPFDVPPASMTLTL